MVQRLNGQAPTLPTDLLAHDDEGDIDAVAVPPETPEPEAEPEVEEGEFEELDPDDIDIVDDDAEPESEAPEPPDPEPAEDDDPADKMSKKEWRQTFARNFTASVKKALRGELDPKSLNASERSAYREFREWQEEVERPLKQTREEAAWSEYQEMWQASIQNPQQFNELWRDDGRRNRWLQMEQNRSVLGLHPGIDPVTFRERFNEYNAQFKDETLPPGTAAEEYLEEIQDSPLWRDLSDEEKASLAPTKFKGSDTQVIAAMAYRRGLLASEVKARKARRPVEERIRDVNKTATNAQKAAKRAPLGVVRGQRSSMPWNEVVKLAASGDPQGLRLYEKGKKLRKARAG